MSFEVLLSKSNKEAFDITQLVSSTEVTENTNRAGICTFAMIAGEVRPQEGNAIMVSYDGVPYFAGYVFATTDTQEGTVKVTAYDQLVYLKTSDTKVFDNLPLEKIVRQLCDEYSLRIGELEPTGYPLGRRLYDGKQLLDMVANCISLTLRATGEMYYLKDVGGYVTLRNIRSTISDIVVEPGSLLSGYDYTRSIEESSNQIKLVRDNKETGKRELYIAKDSGNISRWGLLQHYEKLDDAVNPAQAKEKADALLLLKNRVQQSLTLEVLGDSSIRAGKLIRIKIPDVELEKFLLCTTAQHSFSNTGHTIKITLRLV